jgi:hypothetical protein
MPTPTVSLNKIVNLLVADIKANLGVTGIVCENWFYLKPEDLDNKMTQGDAIYVLMDGEEETPLAMNTNQTKLNVSFIVIEQMVGADETREDFLVDLFRAFIRRRKVQTIIDYYPTNDFQRFFLRRTRRHGWDEAGRVWWIVNCDVEFFSENLT